MNKQLVSIFVSHSNKDLKLTEEIERLINKSYIKLFFAHRDIDGSEEWKDTIHAEINKCDGMLALVTPNFHTSEYTAQEVGAAWALKRPILPVRVDKAHPKGFIKGIQWITYNNSWPYGSTGKIIKFALSQNRKHEEMVDIVVEMLIGSESYLHSGCLTTILESEGSLTPKQIADIKYALETNSQVSDASRVLSKLEHLIASFKS